MTPQELKVTCRYLVGAARRIWRWNPDRKEINRDSELDLKGKRRCAHCSKVFDRKGVHVDHIIPVGHAPTEFTGWDEFYRRLFCERTNLQSLCVECHKAKTKTEAGERAIKRRTA